jgi:hypothetical protein
LCTIDSGRGIPLVCGKDLVLRGTVAVPIGRTPQSSFNEA